MRKRDRNGLYRSSQVAKILGVTPRTLYRMLGDGRIQEPMRNPDNQYRLWTEVDLQTHPRGTQQMIKLMVGNQKGGVGKTTSAITLARCLAGRGLENAADRQRSPRIDCGYTSSEAGSLPGGLHSESIAAPRLCRECCRPSGCFVRQSRDYRHGAADFHYVRAGIRV